MVVYVCLATNVWTLAVASQTAGWRICARVVEAGWKTALLAMMETILWAPVRFRKCFFSLLSKKKPSQEVPNDIYKGNNYDHCMASPWHRGLNNNQLSLWPIGLVFSCRNVTYIVSAYCRALWDPVKSSSWKCQPFKALKYCLSQQRPSNDLEMYG